MIPPHRLEGSNDSDFLGRLGYESELAIRVIHAFVSIAEYERFKGEKLPIEQCFEKNNIPKNGI